MACQVCGSIFRDGPPGNCHTDGVLTVAPANARCTFWTLMGSFQALSTLEYFSSELIGQRVFVNTIASINRLPISMVPIWCSGTLRYPLAFGSRTLLSPPALGTGSAWAGKMSDSCNILMVDFWHLRNGGAKAPDGCRRFRTELRAMTVLARFHFIGSGTLVVCII